MRTPVQHLEPAVRDPRKLRNTALILTAIMIASAVGIFVAYLKLAERQANDDTPSFKGRLDPNQVLKVWRQDESEGDLGSLQGHVYVIAPVLFSDPERWQHTRAVLERLAKKYADREDFHIVCLTVDPENEPPKKLAEYAKELDATLPKWWLAATREESTHKFLKNILRMEVYPHREDGKWIYDGAVVVIDRDRHIRKGTVKMSDRFRTDAKFDFEAAAAWGKEHPVDGDTTRVSRDLEDLLVHVIDHVLAKPVTKQ
ncbi:SCO family protein [Luteolibacter sp. GHJ8]|uniref:SCO family protein n=1 Tax=Luteolibacter rhizosphaerae TaxID=2989719 RepID=A0ABT3G7W1_9BACT|nr:SCO family protein [Luteolibacter rhizosphaerae]MCW1915707.1 SCO family protein [Luteolibacter rhizosphaerae]